QIPGHPANGSGLGAWRGLSPFFRRPSAAARQSLRIEGLPGSHAKTGEMIAIKFSARSED
ncbi:MAG: hypothetical protein D4R39_02230, partial [Methylophilaceae bacterium]